jgi:hypothetical protein
MKPVITCLVILAFTLQAIAQPAPPAPPASTRTVIVLPIDGDADEALRKGLTAAIEKAAKADPTATVKQGGTTFGETAAAVGCDPATPPCAETVLSTLAMDEMIYGTATNTDGKITVVVRKKVKDKDPQEVTTTIEATDAPDKIEPAIKPLVGGSEAVPPVTCPDNATPGPDGTCPAAVVKPKKPVNTTRVLTIAGMIGGGVLVIGGLGMWSSANGLQGEIDDAPTPTTSGDFAALEAKEDKASSRAWTGNLLVLGGLGLAGYSYYRFRKTGKTSDTMVTPAPVPGGGAAVVIRIVR